MYDARIEVILRHILKTKKVDLSYMDYIYNKGVEDVTWLYYEHSVAILPRCRSSPEIKLRGLRKELNNFLEKFEWIKSNLSNSDYVISLLDYDDIPAGFFSFCTNYFGDINVRALIALDTFKARCLAMVEEIDKGTFYEVADYNLNDISFICSLVGKNYFIEDGIRLVLEFLDYQEKRNFIYLLMQLCKKYKLLDAKNDRFKFIGYFNNNLFKRLSNNAKAV